MWTTRMLLIVTMLLIMTTMVIVMAAMAAASHGAVTTTSGQYESIATLVVYANDEVMPTSGQVNLWVNQSRLQKTIL